MKAGHPRRADQVRRHCLGLDAVDRALHLGIEILHAQAQPIEALPAQHRHPRRADRARIDLDRILPFRVGREVEPLAQARQQSVHLGVSQVSWRAAAEMQLRQFVPAGEQAPLHGDLALQVSEVLDSLGMVVRDQLVAGAVVAQRLAKWNVHVQRQRPRRGAAGAGRGRHPVVGGAEAGTEAVGRRIRGVARARLVQAPDQLCVELDSGVVHGASRLSKAWRRYAAHSTTRSPRCTRRRRR